MFSSPLCHLASCTKGLRRKQKPPKHNAVTQSCLFDSPSEADTILFFFTQKSASTKLSLYRKSATDSAPTGDQLILAMEDKNPKNKHQNPETYIKN